MNKEFFQTWKERENEYSTYNLLNVEKVFFFDLKEILCRPQIKHIIYLLRETFRISLH